MLEALFAFFIFAFFIAIALVPVVMFAAAFGAIIYYAINTGQKTTNAWEAVASRLGLTYVKGGLLRTNRIRGRYRGTVIAVWIRRETKGRPKRQRVETHTVVEAHLHRRWQGVTIETRGLGARVATFFGGEDTEIGDPAFDKAYRIQGILGLELQDALLRQDVQNALAGVRAHFTRFSIEEGILKAEIRENIRDQNRLIWLIDMTLDHVDQLNGPFCENPAQEAEVVPTPAEAEELFPEIEDGGALW